MAKAVQPLMSLEARGKMGGLIYNTWRGIATVKAFKSPSQPNTAAQLERRSVLTELSREWAALTSTQREAWQTYAQSHLQNDWTGNPLRLTAQNWFVRCGARAILVGGSSLASPPSAAAPVNPSELTFSVMAGSPQTVQVTWDGLSLASQHLVIYGAGPFSRGRTPRKEQAAIVAILASNSMSPAVVISNPAAGKWGFWTQVIDDTTGLASSLLYNEVIV